MAKIIGCLAMSHSPQLHYPPEKWPGMPFHSDGPFHPKADIEKELTPDVMGARAARCRQDIAEVRRRLEALAPDTLVIIGDDQHENFQDDCIPPFSIFTGPEAPAKMRPKYLELAGLDGDAPPPVFRNNVPLAESLVYGLMAAGFDPGWARETRFAGGLGHAFARPLFFLSPDARCRVVAVTVNTFYRPAPTTGRCLDFGRALGALLRASDAAERVVVLGSGGLSHTRIDENLDAGFIRAIETMDWDHIRALPSDELIEGTSELRTWIITAGCADTKASMIDYVPCYRTEQGIGCAMGFAYW